MTNEIENEIKEAIKKNLPEHVGSLLAAELSDLARLRVAAKDLKVSLDLRTAERDDARATIAKLKENEKTDASLETKKAEITNREFRLEITELQLRIANERREEIKTLVIQLFRSPVRTELVNGSMPVAVPGMTGTGQFSGTAGTLMTGMINKTTTTSEA